MGIFGNKFEQPSVDEGALVKRAEAEVNVLASDLKRRNWTEIWDSLSHTEINSSSIVSKMSPEAQESLKQVINEVKEVFAAEKESVEKDLVDDIQKSLDKISENF